MNLNIIGNNFGASLAGQTLKVHQTKYYAVVNGVVTVQPGNPAYERAEVLELTVDGLLINTSGPTSVYATMIVGEVQYITIAKAWVKDQSTICIEKVGGWSSQAWYKLNFQCIFFPLGLDFCPSLHRHTSISFVNPTENFQIGTTRCAFYDEWMFIAISFGTFKADTADTSFELALSGVPETAIGDLMLVYNDPSLVNLGSGYIDIGLVGNRLIADEGMPQLAIDSTSRKFIKGAIVFD